MSPGLPETQSPPISNGGEGRALSKKGGHSVWAEAYTWIRIPAGILTHLSASPVNEGC